ncbi:hypothetical protein Pmani_038171, partial [Petrolisthes manimaculis]
NRIGVGLSA